GNEAVIEVACRYRDVIAEPERVVLINPCIVARLRAVRADTVEARAWILVERPALRAVIAGCGRSVENLALRAVERAQMAARHRHPHDTLAVDVGAANAVARHRRAIDFRQCRHRPGRAPASALHP